MAGNNGPTLVADVDHLEQPDRDFKRERKLHIVRNHKDFDGQAPSARADSFKRRGMLDRSQQAQLGNLLRSLFSDIAEEPVPDRFVKLLEALAARESKP